MLSPISYSSSFNTYQELYSRAAQHAAITAPAFQVANRIFAFFKDNHHFIDQNTPRNNVAYFFSQQGAVLKIDDPDRRIEAQLVSDFFALSSAPNLPVFYPKVHSRGKFISISPLGSEQRGISVRTLSLKLRLKQAICEKLPQKARFILNFNEADIFLTPRLSPEEELLYRRCESTRWSYRDSREKLFSGSTFKSLHFKCLTGEASIDSIKPDTHEYAPFDLVRVTSLICAQWKVVTPYLFIEESRAKVSQFAIQPYVNDMVTCNRGHNPRIINQLLHRLTAQAEYSAILSSEIQMLDLHAANLGIQMAPSPGYERFRPLKFDFVTKEGERHEQASFLDLTLFFYFLDNREKALDMHVTYTENGEFFSGKLSELSDLLEAVEGKWQLVFFDIELAISESNYLQQILYQGRECLTIPLRSAFLEFPWCKTALQEKTLEHLLSDCDRLPALEKWMQKQDNILYQRMTPEEIEKINAWIQPLLTPLNLSEVKRDLETKTLPRELLKRKFAEALTSQTKDDKEWEIIKKYLKPQKEDYSEQEIEKIAAYLFPRLTVRQQAALKERLERKNSYLMGYNHLKNSRSEGALLVQELRAFLALPSAPLHSNDKETLCKQVDILEKNKEFADLLILKRNICESCAPSFFNIQAAMYPLFADTYYLSFQVAKKLNRRASEARIEQLAGGYIGFFDFGLEKQINFAKKFLKDDLEVLKLCNVLEEKIKGTPLEDIACL